MLSVTCLIRRLQEWTQDTTPLHGILATDNSGLIDRISSQTLIRYPVPNSVFLPDWDVVEAIVNTVLSSHLLPSYAHVKGHQDDDTPHGDLSLLAQLNVEADKHAGLYHAHRGQHRPVIPLSPTRKIALDLSGHTIHRSLKTAIRDAAHAQPLLDLMLRRYGWLDTVPDTIDWPAHRRSTFGNPTLRTHYVKLCHDMLPAGKLVSKYNKLPDTKSRERTKCREYLKYLPADTIVAVSYTHLTLPTICSV